MKIPNYAHRISTFQTEEGWVVRVERLLPDGRTDWLNDTPLPTPGKPEDWELFEAFMGNLGKAVGIDSPGVRAHFGIDDE